MGWNAVGVREDLGHVGARKIDRSCDIAGADVVHVILLDVNSGFRYCVASGGFDAAFIAVVGKKQHDQRVDHAGNAGVIADNSFFGHIENAIQCAVHLQKFIAQKCEDWF